MDDQTRQKRREMIREYKTPRDMGVYVIQNNGNGKCYVASNRDLKARINRHMMCLKNNVEQVRELQEDWNRYGADAFSFEIVDCWSHRTNRTTIQRMTLPCWKRSGSKSSSLTARKATTNPDRGRMFDLPPIES